MVLHHPQVGVAHEGLEDGGGYVGVVEAAQGVANVVQQGADHVFLVTPIAQRAGGGLQ
jgi:hypothetical protein